MSMSWKRGTYHIDKQGPIYLGEPFVEKEDRPVRTMADRRGSWSSEGTSPEGTVIAPPPRDAKVSANVHPKGPPFACNADY